MWKQFTKKKHNRTSSELQFKRNDWKTTKNNYIRLADQLDNGIHGLTNLDETKNTNMGKFLKLKSRTAKFNQFKYTL